MKSNRAGKSAKAQHGLLLNVARSIGSTLGTLAAKTGIGGEAVPLAAPCAKKIRSKAAKAGNKPLSS